MNLMMLPCFDLFRGLLDCILLSLTLIDVGHLTVSGQALTLAAVVVMPKQTAQHYGFALLFSGLCFHHATFL